MTKIIRIFGIRNCDSMKKAFAWLDGHGVTYEFIDYKKTGVATSHLPEWNRRAGWEVLLNTRGLTWKKLSDEQRADQDEARALLLMAEYPSLIKRPVVEFGDRILVGFDADHYRAAFSTDGAHAQ
jgi:arsenate reductase